MLFIFIYQGAHASQSVSTIKNPYFSATYFGTYRIPSIFDSSTYERNSLTSPVMYNTLFLNYNLTSSSFVGIVLGMEIQPINFENSSIYNPAVRIGDRRLISTTVVKLSADFRVVLPLNHEAKKHQLITAFVSQDYLTVRPLQSNFFLDSFAIFRWQFFQQNSTGRSLYIFDRTGFNYDLTEHFGVSISSIIQGYIENRLVPQSLQFDNFRLGPGIFLNFKNIEFNTYLTFNTAQPRLNEATLLVLLFAKVI